MSQRGIDFLNEWVRENINVDAYPGHNDERVKAHVMQCKSDAEKAGISVKEIEADMGSIRDFIVNAMTEATDDEVTRLVAKDD